MKITKKQIVAVTLLFLCFLLAACASKSPSAISFRLDGKEITLVELLNGSELTDLTAELTPADFNGEILWSCEDSGIVKLSYEGNRCNLVGKKTGSTTITATCGSTSATIRVHVLKNQEKLSAADTALTINGVAYSTEMMNICYTDRYYSFLESYGTYASYYGLDDSLGIESLSEQTCDYSDDGTWRGYFLSEAESMLCQVQALCDYAEDLGITLNADELSSIEDQMQAMEDKAKTAGLTNAADYLAAYYGSEVTEAMYREYLERLALADQAYLTYENSLTFSTEEMDEYFAELGYEESDYSYQTAGMRHILILAEEDENGVCTEESKAAVHERAEEIYREWLDGDATEESFAALAEQYSEDTGSKENGGLYEEIYDGEMVDGINEWLFHTKKGRKVGDVEVIDNEGSYTGTHVVYFTGYGELYSRVVAKSELLSEAMDTWFSELTAPYTVTPGRAYSQIASFT